MKTLEQFENQPEETAVDLDVFLGLKPIEIDEDLYHHICCAYTAEHCSHQIDKQHYISQGGDAMSSVKDSFLSDEILTYMTVVMYPDHTYWFLGILPDLDREDF